MKFFGQIQSSNFFHWTCLAAYVQVSMPSQAGSVEKFEDVDLAEKIFHQLILPQELVVVRSPNKFEEMWKGLVLNL